MVEIRMQKTQKTPNVSETAEFTWLKVPPLEIQGETSTRKTTTFHHSRCLWESVDPNCPQDFPPMSDAPEKDQLLGCPAGNDRK